MRTLALAVVTAAALGAGCDDGARARREAAPVEAYPARSPAWPPTPWSGTIGRGPAPRALQPLAITLGAGVRAAAPERIERVWALPGPGPARAAVSGTASGRPIVEGIDVDAGVVRWRSDACPGPVVAVVADAIVCADAARLVGLGGDDGAARWQLAGRFVAASDDLLILADGADAVVVDASAGTEAARFAPGVAIESLIAACRRDGAVDVWSWAGGALGRLDVRGSAATRAWATPVSIDGPPARPQIDPCDDSVVLRFERDDGEALVALARSDGHRLGGPVTARGSWPARTGEGLGIELAGDDGLVRVGGDLLAPRRLDDARLGRLIASHGAQRLVADRSGGAVLLGEAAPIALAVAPEATIVLGDRALLMATPRGDGLLVHRWGLPVGASPPDAAAVPPPAADPDERGLARFVDLPAARPIDRAAAIALPAAGAHALVAALVDRLEPSAVYAAVREVADGPVGVARFDLRARRWQWYTPAGCPPGGDVALAVAGDTVVCASRGGAAGMARGSGSVYWRRDVGPVSSIAAGGEVVALGVGDEIVILASELGDPIDVVHDDRGGAPRFAIVTVAGQGAEAGPSDASPEPLLIVAERGGVVARAPRLGMLPRWALRVEGTVSAIAAAGDGIAIALASGELYLVDAAGHDAVSVAGFAERWVIPGGGSLIARADAADREWRLAAYGLDGVARFHTGLDGAAPWRLSSARGPDRDAPLVVDIGPSRTAAIDPKTGLVTRVVELGAAGAAHLSFATTVDGAPVAGTLFAQPLAISLF